MDKKSARIKRARKTRAKIKELRFGSEIVSGVVTYKAVLATNNPELLLRPGMTATAEITVQRNVLCLSLCEHPDLWSEIRSKQITGSPPDEPDAGTT